MRARSEQEIANVLLNQRVVAGIGNIYKNESLFAARVNPFAPVSSLLDEHLRRILAAARKQLQHSTRNDDRDRKYWVYRRAGQQCRRCGTVISYRKQGPDARGTHWCGKCQDIRHSEPRRR